MRTAKCDCSHILQSSCADNCSAAELANISAWCNHSVAEPRNLTSPASRHAITAVTFCSPHARTTALRRSWQISAPGVITASLRRPRRYRQSFPRRCQRSSPQCCQHRIPQLNQSQLPQLSPQPSPQCCQHRIPQLNQSQLPLSENQLLPPLDPPLIPANVRAKVQVRSQPNCNASMEMSALRALCACVPLENGVSDISFSENTLRPACVSGLSNYDLGKGRCQKSGVSSYHGTAGQCSCQVTASLVTSVRRSTTY